MAARVQTGRIDDRTEVLRRRRSEALLLYGLGCLVALFVVYLVAVRTGVGQHLDDDALLGRTYNQRVVYATGRLLHSIDITSAALVGGAIIVIALARARVWLAGAAAGLIVGALLTTELLKRALTRPVLNHPTPLPAQSFPSGHTTVAASLALGFVLVVPPRWRGLSALLGTAYAVAIGIGTVTAAWHRPSDAIGGFLVAVGWAALVTGLLIEERGPGSQAARRAASRSGRITTAILVVTAAALIAVGFAVASLLAALHHRHVTVVPIGAAYAASAAVIAAAAALLVAGLLVLLRGVRLDHPPRRWPTLGRHPTTRRAVSPPAGRVGTRQ